MSDRSSHNNAFEELCAGYVLGALSEEDRHRFETMLADADQSQRQLFRQLRAAANQIAFTVEAESPSPAVKQQLMERVQETSNDDKKRSNRFMMAVAACFALFVITAALIFYSFNLSESIDNKEAIIAQQQQKIIRLQNKVQKREELLSILSARTVDMIVMTGLEVNTDGYGKIIWDPETNRALLQLSNLPPDPPGKDYQLWLIKNNKPIPAGVFSVNTTDEASFFKVQEIPNVSEEAAGAFAVTLEPEGGVPQPTGEMYLLGSAE